jgi:fructose-1,6-bisphosphatase II
MSKQPVPSPAPSNPRTQPRFNVSVADLERLVGMEFMRATESAALAAHSWMGKGNKEAGDAAASDAIRAHFDSVNISGLVTIGEGIKDDAPGIFKGEKLGLWTPGSLKMAIALDPIDGTTIVAKGLSGAVSVIAAATCADESEDPMSMLADIPSFYMQKIAVGPKVAQGPVQVRLDNPVKENLEIVALKLGKRVQDVVVSILDRPRHQALIDEVRSTGATIRLISDGDIAGAIAPSLPDAGVDIYMGTGGSPEAVLAAAAIKCLGGELFCRMWPRDAAELEDLKKNGVTDKELARLYKCEDLARGEGTLFAATGISDSPMLRGVRFAGHHATTHSILMRGQFRTVRYIRTIHDMDHKRLPTPKKR